MLKTVWWYIITFRKISSKLEMSFFSSFFLHNTKIFSLLSTGIFYMPPFLFFEKCYKVLWYYVQQLISRDFDYRKNYLYGKMLNLAKSKKWSKETTKLSSHKIHLETHQRSPETLWQGWIPNPDWAHQWNASQEPSDTELMRYPIVPIFPLYYAISQVFPKTFWKLNLLCKTGKSTKCFQ